MATVRIGKQGRVVIPRAAREQLGLNEGDDMSLSVEQGRLVLETSDSALEAIRRQLAASAGETLLSEELIAERRAETARGD
jgi:AbrB family looped-hinge helix DNA binding protein